MMPLAQQIYWRAPYLLKCWMASLHARVQDRLRFGPEYQQIVAEITDRDTWSADQLRAFQDSQLRSMVKQAAENVPYYRELFAERGIEPSTVREVDDLARIPVLRKETVRQRPRDLVDERRPLSSLLRCQTSGTTGTPLELYRTRWTHSAVFAYMDARFHDVAGVARRTHRSVSIGGHLVARLDRERPPFWVINKRWQQLYMSCYHLGPRYLDHYVDQIRRFGPDYVEGYPSSLYSVARHIIDRGLPPIPVAACFTTAETLFDYHRDAFRQAFQCDTFDQYGAAEAAAFAAECEHHGMHVSPDYGVIEVLDEHDQPVAPGQVGRLVCTSLINSAQPLIRYQIGDLGAWENGSCSCGRPLPTISRLEGRVDDVLITRDGKQVGRLDHVFKSTFGIAAAQIVQEDWDHFRIRVVPGSDYTDDVGRRAATSLADRLGSGEITIELVDDIELTPAGKFRSVLRNFDPQERSP